MHDSVPSTRPRSSRLRLAALSSVAVLAVAACTGTPGASSGASSAGTSPAASTSTGPVESPSASASASAGASASAAASESAAPSGSGSASGDLQVEAKEYAFDLPASATAGPTHLTLNNTGKELHQAQIARLNDGATLEQFTAAIQNPDPSAALGLVTLVGGPTSVQPGQSGSVDVDLKAGTHVFLCFISGADNVPHLAKGMIAPLEVTGTSTAGSLPTGDASLTLQDFSFTGIDSLTTGAHTISVTNNGPQPHEAGIVKLNEGVTVPDVIKMLGAADAQSGPPPWTDVGGMAGITPGTTATFDMDLPAGQYAFVCFVPDAATGKPHVQLGMIAPLTIK
jgi:plastocyanin